VGCVGRGCCDQQEVRVLRKSWPSGLVISKGFALTWYRALTQYSSPVRPFAAPDVQLHVTGQ